MTRSKCFLTAIFLLSTVLTAMANPPDPDVVSYLKSRDPSRVLGTLENFQMLIMPWSEEYLPLLRHLAKTGPTPQHRLTAWATILDHDRSQAAVDGWMQVFLKMGPKDEAIVWMPSGLGQLETSEKDRLWRKLSPELPKFGSKQKREAFIWARDKILDDSRASTETRQMIGQQALSLLKDPDEILRGLAVDILASHPASPQAIEALTGMFEDPSPWVTASATRAVWSFTHDREKALPGLVHLFHLSQGPKDIAEYTLAALLLLRDTGLSQDVEDFLRIHLKGGNPLAAWILRAYLDSDHRISALAFQELYKFCDQSMRLQILSHLSEESLTDPDYQTFLHSLIGEGKPEEAFTLACVFYGALGERGPTLSQLPQALSDSNLQEPALRFVSAFPELLPPVRQTVEKLALNSQKTSTQRLAFQALLSETPVHPTTYQTVNEALRRGQIPSLLEVPQSAMRRATEPYLAAQDVDQKAVFEQIVSLSRQTFLTAKERDLGLVTLLSLVDPTFISEEQKLFLWNLESRYVFVRMALARIEANLGPPLWETEWQGESIRLRRDVTPSASSEEVRYFLDFRGVSTEARRLPSKPNFQKTLQGLPHRLLSSASRSLFFLLDPKDFNASDFDALAGCLQVNTANINRALQNASTSHSEHLPELGGLAFAPPSALQEVFVRNPQERLVIEWDGTVNLVRQTIDNRPDTVSVGEISLEETRPTLRFSRSIEYERYHNENGQDLQEVYRIEDVEES